MGFAVIWFRSDCTESQYLGEGFYVKNESTTMQHIQIHRCASCHMDPLSGPHIIITNLKPLFSNNAIGVFFYRAAEGFNSSSH